VLVGLKIVKISCFSFKCGGNEKAKRDPSKKRWDIFLWKSSKKCWLMELSCFQLSTVT